MEETETQKIKSLGGMHPPEPGPGTFALTTV